MRVINRDEVSALLSMEACIPLMEAVLTDLALGRSRQYLRSIFPVHGQSAFAVMPGQLDAQHVLGAKMLTIFPDNHQRGLPSHQGVVAIFDTENGAVKAVMDAQSITAVRTAAASAVATKVLAAPDSHTLAIVGTGEQARRHVEAMRIVRPIQRVTVYGRHPDNARALQQELESKAGAAISVCASVREAVADAEIICTVTGSPIPVLSASWVKAGVHVNAVGASRPTDRELDTALVKQARLFTDRRESARHEAGDYLIPLQEGAIREEHLLGELGELLLGKTPGRIAASDITIFESLGIAIEDLAAAEYIYREAVRRGVGVDVEF